MDNQLPAYLRWVIRRFSFLAVPNLALLVCGLTLLAFIGQHVLHAPMDRFMFDPDLVLQGDWWRVFAYPVPEGMSNPLWLIFYLLYVYYVMNALEQHWGPGPLTLFTFLSYVSAMGAAFVAHRPISIWFYVVQNVSLAFGTLFPNLELLLFFVLPVKAKWLAALAGVLLGWQFIVGGLLTKIFLLIVLAPYFMFFGPSLYRTVKLRWQVRNNRKRHDTDQWR